jgi:DNA modification methylase
MSSTPPIHRGKRSRQQTLPLLLPGPDGRSRHNRDAPIERSGPAYAEVACPELLAEPDHVAESLEKIDWAFTAEDTTYLSHDVHPYPAKFIPQIPGHLIASLSLRGDLVLDPFGGSGTTALEALRLGRRAISIDANPIAALIGRVKTARLHKHSSTDLIALRTNLLARLGTISHDSNLRLSEVSRFIPPIPNREKWFSDIVCAELATIRSLIENIECNVAKDIANLALSRIAVKVSFQDSETRYASRPRTTYLGDTIRTYLTDLDAIIQSVTRTTPQVRYGVAQFITADIRNFQSSQLCRESVDLIVTSPPYGNANDYHLYHRFRLLWLGFEPRELAAVEIGSHLKHQRESNGFDAYLQDLSSTLNTLVPLLRPGRYAAFVLGDSIYDGNLYDVAGEISAEGKKTGLKEICIISRPLHRTKRSFIPAGRRATSENILVLQKPSEARTIVLQAPPYRLWDYEARFRRREIESICKTKPKGKGQLSIQTGSLSVVPKLRRVAFSHSIVVNGSTERTWQAILENGLSTPESSRKDPKYVTHGIHGYKGKFYPQLAKALMNVAGLESGAIILDPFCGSGTTLLEGYLNGLSAFGCDLHPLAAKITRAKTQFLELNPDLVSEAVAALLDKIDSAPTRLPHESDQFVSGTTDEINSWFPEPVVWKLNWLLRAIRSVSASTLRDFFETILSSIVRLVSHQEPADLRIRRRKVPLADADVLKLFKSTLLSQYQRVEHFWAIRGYCPCRFIEAKAVEGDARLVETFRRLGIKQGSVDLVLTSPPYATALPYIDTDRLSLLVLFGLTAADRRPLEFRLSGSREIARRDRENYEKLLCDSTLTALPKTVTDFIRNLHNSINNANVGFRRQNLPSLLVRFFLDMEQVLRNCFNVIRNGGEAMVVIGDNNTTIADSVINIPTAKLISCLGQHLGFMLREEIPITVTRENLLHSKHSITENVVLRFKKTVK